MINEVYINTYGPNKKFPATAITLKLFSRLCAKCTFSVMESTSKDNLTSYKTLDVAVSSLSKKRLVKTELKIASFYILLLQVYKKKVPLEMYSAKIKTPKLSLE